MAAVLFLSGIGALATFNMIAQRPWAGKYEDRYNSDKDPHPDKPDQWDTPGTNVKEYAVNPSIGHNQKKRQGTNLHNGNTDKKHGNHWKG